jgi:predicted transposase YdaD
MISRTPDQRRHYDARLKWELDENTRIQTAFEEGEIKGREEGELKGREEGELFGKIRMLQNLLSLPQSTDDALHPSSRTDLETLVTELQAQLRKRMT